MRKQRIVLAEFNCIAEDAPLDDINDILDSEEITYILMFPLIRSERDIVDLISTLCIDPRWQYRVHDRTPQRTRVALEWQTKAGKWSRTMGLAPLFTMPPTRRSPYAAIALWPGSARRTQSQHVGFGDIPSEMDDAAHQNHLAETETRVGQLFEEPSRPWRQIAFGFSADVVLR